METQGGSEFQWSEKSRKLVDYLTPGSLVILAVLGLVKGYSFPSANLNSFDQLGFSSMVTGGLIGLCIIPWNLTLTKHLKDVRRHDQLTIAAATFGLALFLFNFIIFVCALVTARDRHSFLVPFILVVASAQLLVVIGWVLPNLMRFRNIVLKSRDRVPLN